MFKRNQLRNLNLSDKTWDTHNVNGVEQLIVILCDVIRKLFGSNWLKKCEVTGWRSFLLRSRSLG